MVIANPIYDVVFKRMMQDKRISKFFIETLTGEEIVELELKPQELAVDDRIVGIVLMRLDFSAKIKTKEGTYKNVLIEIQKAKNAIDVMRFRNYLAEQYKKEDYIGTVAGKEKKSGLPIITIYLLGFKLDEIDTAAVRVDRHYFDLVNNKFINKKSNFIEKLTHDCYVVQIPRIQQRLQSKLDLLLSVFEQSNFADPSELSKYYDYEINDVSIKNIVEVLNYSAISKDERKELEDEIEAHRVYDVYFGDLREEIYDKEKAIEEKDKELEEKDKELEEKDKELEEKNKTLSVLEEELLESKRMLEEMKRRIAEK